MSGCIGGKDWTGWRLPDGWFSGTTFPPPRRDWARHGNTHETQRVDDAALADRGRGRGVAGTRWADIGAWRGVVEARQRPRAKRGPTWGAGYRLIAPAAWADASTSARSAPPAPRTTDQTDFAFGKRETPHWWASAPTSHRPLPPGRSGSSGGRRGSSALWSRTWRVLDRRTAHPQLELAESVLQSVGQTISELNSCALLTNSSGSPFAGSGNQRVGATGFQTRLRQGHTYRIPAHTFPDAEAWGFPGNCALLAATAPTGASERRMCLSPQSRLTAAGKFPSSTANRNVDSSRLVGLLPATSVTGESVCHASGEGTLASGWLPTK